MCARKWDKGVSQHACETADEKPGVKYAGPGDMGCVSLVSCRYDSSRLLGTLL